MTFWYYLYIGLIHHEIVRSANWSEWPTLSLLNCKSTRCRRARKRVLICKERGEREGALKLALQFATLVSTLKRGKGSEKKGVKRKELSMYGLIGKKSIIREKKVLLKSVDLANALDSVVCSHIACFRGTEMFQWHLFLITFNKPLIFNHPLSPP